MFVSPGGTAARSPGREPEDKDPIQNESPGRATADCVVADFCRPSGALVPVTADFPGLAPRALRCRRSAAERCRISRLTHQVA